MRRWLVAGLLCGVTGGASACQDTQQRTECSSGMPLGFGFPPPCPPGVEPTVVGHFGAETKAPLPPLLSEPPREPDIQIYNPQPPITYQYCMPALDGMGSQVCSSY